MKLIKLQTVHFRSETYEFGGRLGTRFAFHLAEDSLILFRVQRMGGLEITGVELVRRLLYVLVQILCLNFATHRICIGEQETATFVVFGFEIVVIKLVHG